MKAFLGNILHILDKNEGAPSLAVHLDSALLCSDDGRIIDIQSATNARKKVSPENTHDYSGHWILPGFVDTHVHYPQINIIGSFGAELLAWLDKYTFPEEKKFSDPDYAKSIARLFCETLIRNGTTTAAVFGTSHLEATKILHDSMHSFNLNGWIGKSSMDRNAPPELTVELERDLV